MDGVLQMSLFLKPDGAALAAAQPHYKAMWTRQSASLHLVQDLELL
jgi:hypothetical protein